MNHKHDPMIVEMLEAAESYCAANDVRMSTLGRFIMDDGEFFKNLRCANNCTIKTYRRVMKWLKERSGKRKLKNAVALKRQRKIVMSPTPLSNM